MSNATHGGKGDKARPVDRSKYENNWDKIFGKKEAPVAMPMPDESWLDDMLDEDLGTFTIADTGLDGSMYWPPIDQTQVEIERKLKEWGMMYDCLQNIHLYEYPVEEARALLKQIKVS